MKKSQPDDHPVRTTFIEAVARRCGMPVDRARGFVAPISTDVLDRWWPIDEVDRQFRRGDLVAVYYPDKQS